MKKENPSDWSFLMVCSLYFYISLVCSTVQQIVRGLKPLYWLQVIKIHQFFAERLSINGYCFCLFCCKARYLF